ncbi:MAG: hypothetical protein HUK02_05930 [Bacteroidaceae bacterium]|nr:hypothetical protein [Bacteroidaceae bacterium]
MKKYFIILATIATLGLFASCESAEESTANSGQAVTGSKILIGNTELNAPATRTAAATTTLATVTSDDAILTLTETVTPYAPATRASIITTSTLNQAGQTFKMEGYLDPKIKNLPSASAADKADQHFIKGATVTCDGSNWTISPQPNWRQQVYHYFWEYKGNPTNFTVDANDYEHVTFSYTNPYNEDLLVAHQKKYWQEGDGDALTPITFDHALSAITVDKSNIGFKVKDNNGTPQPDNGNRGELVDIQIRSISEGDCDVTGGQFTWTTPTTPTYKLQSVIDGTPAFFIPQSKSTSFVQIIVKDKTRGVTRPYTFDSQLFKDQLNSSTTWQSGTWEAGKQYNYDIQGNFVLPYLSNQTIGGLRLEFDGNKFKQDVTMDNINLQYVERIKISWTGTPTVNGNGTWVMLAVMPISQKVEEGDFFKQNGKPKIDASTVGDNKQIVFAYDAFATSNNVKRGSYDSSTGTYSAEFSLTDVGVNSNSTAFKIVALYWGGDNSGKVEWILQDFTLEITQWK